MGIFLDSWPEVYHATFIMAKGCEKSGDELSSVHVDFTSIVGAISGIRKKNIRPDLTSIYQYLRKQGLACEETEVSDTSN